jgi:hypothetical protein
LSPEIRATSGQCPSEPPALIQNPCAAPQSLDTTRLFRDSVPIPSDSIRYDDPYRMSPPSGKNGPGNDGSAPASVPLELPAATVKARKPEPDLDKPMDWPGTLRLKRDDMTRAVSALGDPSRLLQTMPGVGRPDDWETTLLVRGGSPDQTVFLVDGLPMQRVNHYEGMRNEHGGTGVLNLEFADSISFHSGAFAAHLPDRLSGVVEIGFRDGDTLHAHTRLSADVTGAGANMEGPLGGARGSYAAVFRYSTLDLLVRSGVVEAFGVPRYYNGQMRFYLPMGASALRANIVGGEESWHNGIGRAADLDVGGHTLSTGLDWQSTQGPVWTRAALYYQDRAQDADFRSIENEKSPGRDSLSHRETGSETRYGAIVERAFPLGPRLTVRAGAEENLAAREYAQESGDEQMFLPGRDTTITYTGSQRSSSSRPASEAAAYVEATWASRSWELYAGYRHFYEEISDRHGFGPRLAVKFRPARNHSLGLGLGLHTQAHDYLDLARRPDPESARLPYMAQSALGWQWDLPRGAAFSLEGFAKEGFHLARAAIAAAPAQGGAYAPVSADTGRTRSLGWEAYLRKPRGGFFSGSAAYTYLWHRERDYAGRWAQSSYSVPHSFNASAEAALGRGFYLGTRYSLASGIPYIPFDSAASMRAGAGAYDLARAYSVREKAYERLDVRLEMERRLGSSVLTAFAELENVLDRHNYFERRWNPLEGNVAVMEGMGRLPVAGVSLSL